jgi:hypothetical protein
MVMDNRKIIINRALDFDSKFLITRRRSRNEHETHAVFNKESEKLPQNVGCF